MALHLGTGPRACNGDRESCRFPKAGTGSKSPAMFDTFLSVLPVFAMILAGYGAARTGILPASANRDLNRFVVWIALPALMFHIVATTDWKQLWNGDFVIASLAGSLAPARRISRINPVDVLGGE